MISVDVQNAFNSAPWPAIVTCGVPQGSVLGPTLWNVFYDRMLNLRIQNVSLVGYADDLVAIVTAPDRAALEDRGNRALRTILRTPEEMEVTVATHKTEAVMVRGRRKVPSATFTAEERQIDTRETMKYLGVYINRNLTMGHHIVEMEKAIGVMWKLMGLMPNNRGPAQKTRTILAASVYSTILYAAPAAPAWNEVVR